MCSRFSYHRLFRSTLFLFRSSLNWRLSSYSLSIRSNRRSCSSRSLLL
nr:MAG TPA: hypothetical protein [Crassvirales sp.]DAK71220.1 MAG TPA: hypothetical protein [Caudoviricetes sp.]DAP79205.1 MAG TPA: hypothetical protein [Caudoviricetes sp.]